MGFRILRRAGVGWCSSWNLLERRRRVAGDKTIVRPPGFRHRVAAHTQWDPATAAANTAPQRPGTHGPVPRRPLRCRLESCSRGVADRDQLLRWGDGTTGGGSIGTMLQQHRGQGVDDLFGCPPSVATRWVRSPGFSAGSSSCAPTLRWPYTSSSSHQHRSERHLPALHRREGSVLKMLLHGVPATTYPRHRRRWRLGRIDHEIDGRTMPVASGPADVQRLLRLVRRVCRCNPRGPEAAAASDHSPEPHANLRRWSGSRLTLVLELDGSVFGVSMVWLELDAFSPTAMVGTGLLHVDVRLDDVLRRCRRKMMFLVGLASTSRSALPGSISSSYSPPLHLDGGFPPRGVFAAPSHVMPKPPRLTPGGCPRRLLSHVCRSPTSTGSPDGPLVPSCAATVARSWIAQRLRCTEPRHRSPNLIDASPPHADDPRCRRLLIVPFAPIGSSDRTDVRHGRRRLSGCRRHSRERCPVDGSSNVSKSFWLAVDSSPPARSGAVGSWRGWACRHTHTSPVAR